ncbi:hypothetical protein BDV96DRAFT_603940 [Lophiotrema nucula]|uniref:Uncharacterized protein n=1 Tax=Lophiotrema nucula TaxID=690887 RepID=A0A6A5YW47_9PLEO|nr:hypothetical protein BDV96DRAFT_603940 [Lophiotrema nucula]
MSSQIHLPSANRDLYLLSEFAGLQFHRADPALRFNRFELELVEPGSNLNNEIRSTYRNKSQTARIPQFTYVQLTNLALLSSPTRTLSVKQIVQWLCANFPGIKVRQQQERARGVLSDQDCVATLTSRVTEYCHLSETNWHCDLVAVGETGVPQPKQRNSNCPKGSDLSYYMPYGLEEEKFAQNFNMTHIHSGFGLTPPCPTSDVRTRQRTFLMDLPKKIKLRILSNLLTFPNPVSVHWHKERQGPIVAVFMPPAQRTSRAVRTLWVPEYMLSAVQVCKEFEELGRFSFYSTNTFLFDTAMQPEYPNILHSFLSRIGPKSRKLLRSVQFNMDMSHHTDKMIKECVAKLGESYCLQFITLDIKTSTLPNKALADPTHIAGLADPAHRYQSILRFKGLKHITIFNNRSAQIYVDTCMSKPHAFRELELVDERAEAARLEAEEELKRPDMGPDELATMHQKRRRRTLNIAEHQRQLDMRQKLEKDWAGPAGMTLKQRAKGGEPPILDEVVLVQRPGMEDGYLGADPKVLAPGVGHGKVYDMDVVWGDNERRGNVQAILRLMRGQNVSEMEVEVAAEVAAPEGPAPPPKKRRKPNTAKCAPVQGPPALHPDLPRKRVKKQRPPVPPGPSGVLHEPGSIDVDEVEKAVNDALDLEAKYRETKSEEEAKKEALRAVLSKVMFKGADTA